MLESKISNVPDYDSFAVPFMHWKLRRGCKENYMKEGESKAGAGL